MKVKKGSRRLTKFKKVHKGSERFSKVQEGSSWLVLEGLRRLKKV